MSFLYIHLLKAFIQHGIWSLLNACYCLPISKCLRISIDLRSCYPISCRWRDWPYKVIRWLESINNVCRRKFLKTSFENSNIFIVIDNSISLMHTTFTPVKCIEQATWNCFRHRWFTHDHEYNQFPCHLNKHLMPVKGSSCTRIKISVDNWNKRCIRRK